MLFVLCGCGRVEQQSGDVSSQETTVSYPSIRGISEIYFGYRSSGKYYPDYRISFATKEVHKYNFRGDYAGGPDDSGTDRVVFLRKLTDEKIEEFFAAAERAGFDSWDTEYSSSKDFFVSSDDDSLHWYMTIYYGEEIQPKIIKGADVFPDGWEQMRQIFFGLTGEDILDSSIFELIQD